MPQKQINTVTHPNLKPKDVIKVEGRDRKYTVDYVHGEVFTKAMTKSGHNFLVEKIEKVNGTPVQLKGLKG